MLKEQHVLNLAFEWSLGRLCIMLPKGLNFTNL